MTLFQVFDNRGTSGGQGILLRATFADGTNVPRIPPQRLGGA